MKTKTKIVAEIGIAPAMMSKAGSLLTGGVMGFGVSVVSFHLSIKNWTVSRRPDPKSMSPAGVSANR
jgi:hypothetical protein